jgi:CheY-like chemotaxis protein
LAVGPPTRYIPRPEMQTMTMPLKLVKNEKPPESFAEEYPLRILVAEDNSTNMKVALLMLQRLGYRGDPVRNGVECLEAVNRIKYDVILMDMQMPEMDGIECTRKLREEGNNIRIIALTADALIDAQGRCLQAGMNDYVTKPIARDKLERALRRAHRALPKPKTGTTQPLLTRAAIEAANAAAAGIKPPAGTTKGAKQMGIIASTGELVAVKAEEAAKAEAAKKEAPAPSAPSAPDGQTETQGSLL